MKIEGQRGQRGSHLDCLDCLDFVPLDFVLDFAPEKEARSSGSASVAENGMRRAGEGSSLASYENHCRHISSLPQVSDEMLAASDGRTPQR